MTLMHAPVVWRDDDTIPAESTLIIHRPRRRRWWPWALAAFLVVVVAAVGLTQITAPALSFDGEPVVWRTAPDDRAGVRRLDNALGTEVTVGFERSGAFSARLALVNHGRYPVRILGFPDRSAHYYGLESVETARDADGPAEPFRAFTLRRGGVRWLILHFRFAECDLQVGDGVTASRTSLPINHRTFGLRQRDAVPFSRFALSVPTGRCDRPVL